MVIGLSCIGRQGVGRRRSIRWVCTCGGLLFGRRYGYDENIACYFCAHQPVRGWVGRIEQRVGHPHVEHFIDTEVRVFEQMCSLGVYLKGVVVIKLFWVQ